MGLKGPQRVCEHHCFPIEQKRLFWNQKGVGALQKGANVLVHNRFTSDSRFIRISEDEQFIEVLDPKSNKMKDSISVKSIDSVASGKTTPNLSKAKNALATTSFAVIGSKTYEFECGDKKTRDIWVKSLDCIIFVNKQVDPMELGQQAKEQYMAQQYDQAKSKQFAKNAKKRDDIRKKYKLAK